MVVLGAGLELGGEGCNLRRQFADQTSLLQHGLVCQLSCRIHKLSTHITLL